MKQYIIRDSSPIQNLYTTTEIPPELLDGDNWIIKEPTADPIQT